MDFTANYIFMVAVATGFGAVSSGIVHLCRCFFDRPMDERSIDWDAEFFWRTLRHVEERYIGCERGSDGVWEIGSVRNVAYLLCVFTFVPLAFGVVGWGSRTSIMMGTCGALEGGWVSPFFCRSVPTEASHPGGPATRRS